MAQPLATYNEWMKGLSQAPGSLPDTTNLFKTFGDPARPDPNPVNVQPEAPQAATPTFGVGQDMAPRPTATQQPAAPATPDTDAQAGNLQQFSVSQMPQPGAYGNLFAPATGKAGEQAQAFSGALQSFQEAAGPSRTYAGIGAEGTLGEAVETGTGIEDAASLVGAQYGGPAGIDPAKLAQINQQLAGSQALLQSGNVPVQELLKRLSPELTSGSARWEAKRLRGQEGFRDEAQQQREALQNLIGQIRAGSKQASAFAEQRKGEEADIAQKSREYLKGRESGVLGDIEQRVAAREAERKALGQKYQQFVDTGDLSILAELEQTTDPERVQAAKDYRAKYEALINDPRYEKIKDLPFMTRNEAEGTEFKFDDAWWDAHKKDFKKKEWKELKKLAHDRQREIEGLGERPVLASEAGQYQERTKGAQAEYDRIMKDEFKDIEHLPLLQLKIDRHGRQSYYTIDPDTGKRRDVKGLKDKELSKKLIERQRAMEAAFGHQVDPKAEKRGGKLAGGFTGVGEYRDIAPLYGGDPNEIMSRLFQAEDPRAFYSFDQGARATVENTAEQAEREQFERINQLLGESDRIGTSAVDFDPGDLESDAGRLLEAEQAKERERTGELDLARQKWLKQVKKARDRYKAQPSGLFAIPGAAPLLGAVAGPAFGIPALAGGAWGMGAEYFGT